MKTFIVEVKSMPFFKDHESKTLLKASGVSEFILKQIIEHYHGIEYFVEITAIIDEGE